MRIRATVFAALLLGGCAAHTMAGIRQGEPAITGDSTRATEAIGSCLVDASDKIGIASYVPRPHGATVQIQVTGLIGDKGTVGLADIQDDGDHRHVSLWLARTVWAKQNRHRVESMRACL